MKKLIVATHNQGKVREFRQLFAKYDVETLSLEDLDQDVPEVEETGDTFEENARLKAETISDLLQMPVIADDSGLEIDALNKQPGVYSARYAGEQKDDELNVQKVLRELEGVENRAARFVCVLALSVPGKETIVKQGACEGTITTERLGENGFGYDPIFIPRGHSETMAQLGPDVKNTISHRSEALKEIEATIHHLLT